MTSTLDSYRRFYSRLSFESTVLRSIYSPFAHSHSLLLARPMSIPALRSWRLAVPTRTDLRSGVCGYGDEPLQLTMQRRLGEFAKTHQPCLALGSMARSHDSLKTPDLAATHQHLENVWGAWVAYMWESTTFIACRAVAVDLAP